MPEVHPATKLSLSFAKLVATPTDTTWSQAYNAGNVFVCISLTSEDESEELSLQAIGKELFNVLQSEFFTLQEKNTATIKAAIETSLEQIPEQVTVGVTLAYFKDNTLFVFIAGNGKIIMKRGEKIGTLLAKQGNDDSLSSASGFLGNTDTIILETGQFAKSISQVTLTQALELALPTDIVEALSPEMHKQANGAQAAIVIASRGALLPDMVEEESEADDDDPLLETLASNPPTPETRRQEQLEDPPEPVEEKRKKLNLPKMPTFHFRFSFNHRRRLFLNIALILAFLLILSIFFSMKKYYDDKDKALFQSIYPQAQQYYSEGKGLATVNASLSQDSYKKAQTLLQNGQSKFSKGSTDYQQISDLLAQVNSSLQSNTAGQSTNVTSVQPDAHSILAVEESMGSGLAFGQDTNTIYVITADKITAVSKSDGSTNDIIKNNNYWSAPQAIVPYDGNIYVLDQKNGLIKFVPGGGGYGKSSYFKSGAPDLSSATGMAIDGSVWLLFKNGTIDQYTSGVSNNLQVSGLLKQMNNPTKIVTDVTTEGLYVLDPGNSRIVKFDKTGKYQNAYSASVLSTAKDFTVDETNKKIQILSGGKVWEMNL
jgi:hypothetical protein